MKKKLLVTALIATMALSMTACGGKETTVPSDVDVNNSEVQATGSSETEKESTPEVEIELPNWEGHYFTFTSMVGNEMFGIKIAFPSSQPTSGWVALQRLDAALVLVSTPGIDENYKYVEVESIEDTFSASKYQICSNLSDYRSCEMSDFDFVVENQELLTVNDMPACHYEGTHTYVENGTIHELPFAAYSFYTDQLEGYSYFTVVVIDDSANCSLAEPLPEGTLNGYARKMVESVELQ